MGTPKACAQRCLHQSVHKSTWAQQQQQQQQQQRQQRQQRQLLNQATQLRESPGRTGWRPARHELNVAAFSHVGSNRQGHDAP
jgi:hypothetical protein